MALTFDDGYLEQYEPARMLSKKSIAATFFLITHLRSYNGKALLTTRPELIKKMHTMGHEIGSHTKTHPSLTEVPRDVAEEECLTSRKYLSELIESEVEGFAYPHGRYSDEVADIVRKHYGYARIMGAFNRWNTETVDPYKIGGMGTRHLFKLPFGLLRDRKTRYLVLVFHDEPPRIMANTIGFLKLIGARFATLRELVEKRPLEEPGIL